MVFISSPLLSTIIKQEGCQLLSKEMLRQFISSFSKLARMTLYKRESEALNRIEVYMWEKGYDTIL